MKELMIRDFTEKDLDRILDYREEVARISFPELTLDRKKAREFILTHIEKRPGTLKIAEVERKPVGFIRFRIEKGSFGDYGGIDIIFVEKSHRQQGTGRLLLETAEKWFMSKGIDRVEATITNTNAPSLSFFRSLGYAEKRTVLEKKLG
jgi:ribosomal protein S18 acetylase RimI-like enzyme